MGPDTPPPAVAYGDPEKTDRLVRGLFDDPFALLGPHKQGRVRHVAAFDPGARSVELRSLQEARPGPSVLLFGTEGSGLSEAVLSVADRRVRIAMEPGDT